MSIVAAFTIEGNQDDKLGHPVGYVRMTQRSKHIRWANREKTKKTPQYIYQQWKEFVRKHFQEDAIRRGTWNQAMARLAIRSRHYLSSSFDNKFFVYTRCEFRHRNHCDPENAQKGIVDALFYCDRYVGGFYAPPSYGGQPRVSILIFRGITPVAMDSLCALNCREFGQMVTSLVTPQPDRDNAQRLTAREASSLDTVDWGCGNRTIRPKV